MKKKLALLLAFSLAAGSLAACASPESETEEASEAAPVEQEAFEGEAGDFRVGIMIPGNLGDKSFFDATYSSIELLENDLGVTVDYVEAGLDASKYYSTYVDLCEQDFDVILTVSSNGDDALVQVAEEYPEQKFINLDNTMEEPPANVFVMAPRNNEMSYLAGVVAALKAQELGEDKVGFVGGMDIPGINEFLIGYIEGAQSVDENMKVASSYVGSFTDTAKGKEKAILLYDSGISIIFAAAGQSGLGVIDAAAEKGKLVIGVDSDQAAALKDSQPELAEVIITSAIKNIPQNAVFIVEQAMKGEVDYGQRTLYGVADGAVGLVENEYYEALLSEEARAQVEEVKQQIIEGNVQMTDPTGLSTEEIEKIRDEARP